MKDIRRNLKQNNILRGLDRESKISAEADCRYNNGLYLRGGKTPLQPATQSVFTMNFAINMTAQPLKSTGYVTCPNHEGVCTTNISETTVIVMKRDSRTIATAKYYLNLRVQLQ